MRPADSFTATAPAAAPAAPLPDAPRSPAASTALAAAGQRWRQKLPRQMLVLLAVCLAIALLLKTLDGGRFSIKLTYSLCIGLACATVNDTAWLAQAWAYDQLRRLRGLAASPGPFARGWGGVFSSAAVGLVLGPPLGQFLADSIWGFKSPSIFNLNSTTSRVTLVISALATLVLILIVSAAERLASARAQAEAAQRQAAETQLRLLQSQLEPHMLFNTLANLRVLIGLEPARAQAMLDHLIAYLRATLQASRRGVHPLADEFARLGDYLALMAVRMGPRLRVQLDLPADLQHLPVPPLLLQPLVENSIQHGLEPKVEGGFVHVTAHREGDLLVLEVQDSGIGRASAAAQATASPGRPAGGFGLSGVRERLATLYGDRASLALEDAPGGVGTRARVCLPIVSLTSVPALPVAAAGTPLSPAHSPQP